MFGRFDLSDGVGMSIFSSRRGFYVNLRYVGDSGSILRLYVKVTALSGFDDRGMFGYAGAGAIDYPIAFLRLN